MPWIYYTSISPVNGENSFQEAFNLFLKQFLINKYIIIEKLTLTEYFRFLINTEGENNNIICKDGKIFYKNKFLINKLFKKSLIDYYRPLGIYVKGPKEIIRRDGTITNKWIIELNKC